MIETFTNNEIFLIVFSGVVIFTAQRLISDLWISPNIEFQKCMGKIDTLLIRYEFLCDYEHGSNGGANDDDVKFFKQELKNATTELIGGFNALFFAEKWWLKSARRINIHQTKPELLILSNVVSTRKDIYKEDPLSKKAIKRIRKYLKFKPFIVDYEEVIGK